MRDIVAEAIEAIVEPIIFAEAADLIDWLASRAASW